MLAVAMAWGGEPSALDRVETGIRVLVSDPPWTVDTKTVPASDWGQAAGIDPRLRDALREMRTLSARVSGRDGGVHAFLLRLEDPDSAKRLVHEIRRAFERTAPAETAFADGAGPGGAVRHLPRVGPLPPICASWTTMPSASFGWRNASFQ